MSDKNLQTILKQYSVLKDTIISTVENVDAVKQYIIRWDDDEDEAVDLGLTRTNFRNKKNVSFKSHNVKESLDQ